VKDGQTVVIGGLIQDRYERIERKIPFLGDIPIIGPIFRNKTEAASKTELLIVLTPHVVTTPKAIDNQTESAMNKATLPPDILEQIRRGELDGVRGEIDEDGRLVDPIKSKQGSKQGSKRGSKEGSKEGPEQGSKEETKDGAKAPASGGGGS
jgi:type II secretory pathway component GspD/PulD (secretin)